MTTDQVYFNPWDPEFRANPYPYYAALLACPPPVINLMTNRTGRALFRRDRGPARHGSFFRRSRKNHACAADGTAAQSGTVQGCADHAHIGSAGAHAPAQAGLARLY